jgi:predicted polyphosphate/ATP-dependent NAD kinase
MRILKVNQYKAYVKDRANRPIRVVAQLVDHEWETSCKQCEVSQKNISDGLDKIEESLNNLYKIFERAGAPPRIEKEFGNGTKLLASRATKEELTGIQVAEDAKESDELKKLLSE